MKNFLRRPTGLLVAFAAIVAIPQSSIASTTYTYNFTVDPANPYISTSTVSINSQVYPLVDYDFYLTNTATGLNSVPAITLKTGDTINGTILLSSPWTMPAAADGADFRLALQLSFDALLTFNGSASFFNNGFPVSEPLSKSETTIGGGVVVGLGTSSISPAPSFTFDQIAFSGTMTSAQDYNHNVLSSDSLFTANPQLHVRVTNPVPEVDSYEMMLVGLGLVGFAARQKAKQSR